MENILDFVIYPVQVAKGNLDRKTITTRMMDAATNCCLSPLGKLSFYRELAKAASGAEKVKDKEYDNKPVTDAAVEFAESLQELADALSEGKKEFVYDNRKYQYREEESVDLSTRSGEEANTWRENKLKVEDYESQIADLRTKLNDAKGAMAGAEARYIAKHPTCKKTVKKSIVCL